MAKITKTKSGKWQTLLYDYTDENGKRFYKSITAPTKAEVLTLASEFQKNKKLTPKQKHKMTVGDAVDKYIELSSHLSPSTLQGYKLMRKNAFPSLMPIDVKKLTDEIMQKAINVEMHRTTYKGKPLDPKTIKSEYGLVSSALNKICKLKFDVSLPKKQHKNKDLPSVETIINAIKGTEIELPCTLALWYSFSLSEIRGLTCSSIRNGCINIDKVKIALHGGDVVKQNAKADTRIRKLPLSPYIEKMIYKTPQWEHYKETGEDSYLVAMTAAQIQYYTKKYLKPLSADLTFHALRHMNASIMLALSIPNKYAQERGGWKTSSVMEKVYQHTFSAERLLVDEKINQYFEEKFGQ